MPSDNSLFLDMIDPHICVYVRKMRMRIMPNLLLAVLLTWGLPVAATTLPGCNPLCGRWQLDPAVSDPLEPALDAAFARFKEPRAKHMPEGRAGDIDSMSRAADEAELGPIYERPLRADLREVLVRTLTPPGTLELSSAASDILVATDGRKPLRLTPGEPHARVDSEGTAKISVEWRKEQLTVTERYDHRRQYSRNLALRRSDGAMVLTQQISRPGLPTLILHSIYRRQAESGLESGG